MSVYTNNVYRKSKLNDAWTKVFGFVAPKSHVLDIGCSSGKLGQALKKEKQVHVVGLDIDKADVALAKKNLDDAFVLNIETDDVLQLGTFDTVIMADVIEHLVDPVSALKKVKTLLKKNGRLVFSIPNMANVTTRLDLLEGRFEYKDFGLLDRTHLHFYDHQEVNRVFREAGLQVKETDCTIRNVPDRILRQELKKIGIELTPKLKQSLEKSDALVYQFIGYAVPSAAPRSFTARTTTSLDAVSREIDELNAQHGAVLAEKNGEIDRLTQELKGTEQQLRAIHESTGWRMLTKYYTARSRTQQIGRRSKS